MAHNSCLGNPYDSFLNFFTSFPVRWLQRAPSTEDRASQTKGSAGLLLVSRLGGPDGLPRLFARDRACPEKIRFLHIKLE
jgi:hypothetical protein